MFSTEQMLDAFFILSFGTPLTLLISFWLVGRFIWLPMKEENAKYTYEKIIPPYQNRYPIDPEDLVTDCSGEIIDSSIVVEDTDYGLVIMRYKDETFEYWADATPQYCTLEAVARKFVTGFRCEQLYIHRLYELHKKYTKMMELREKGDQEEDAPAQEKNDGIFAVLKSKIPQVKNKENIITCDKSNTFIKRGRLYECPLFHPEDDKEKEDVPFSFSDWKKLF